MKYLIKFIFIIIAFVFSSISLVIMSVSTNKIIHTYFEVSLENAYLFSVVRYGLELTFVMAVYWIYLFCKPINKNLNYVFVSLISIGFISELYFTYNFLYSKTHDLELCYDFVKDLDKLWILLICKIFVLFISFRIIKKILKEDKNYLHLLVISVIMFPILLILIYN